MSVGGGGIGNGIYETCEERKNEVRGLLESKFDKVRALSRLSRFVFLFLSLSLLR
jgi:hypothetical protein